MNIDDHDRKYPPCVKCGHSKFERSDGNRSCRKCGTIVEDHVEVEEDFETGRCRATTRIRSTPSRQKGIEEHVRPTGEEVNWCLYDGFNTILIAQVDALIQECGAPVEIKNCVFKLWAAYLSRLGVAFYKKPAPVGNTSLVANDEEISVNLESQGNQESFNEIAHWLSQNDESNIPGNVTDCELEGYASSNSQLASSDLDELPFTSVKKKKRGRKEYESNTNLMDLPEEDLTGKEKTKRTANLRNSMRSELKTLSMVKDPESDGFDDSSFGITDDEENMSVTSKSSSRLTYMQTNVEDCFKDNSSITQSLRSEKTEDFVGPRTVYTDAEYLTLHKLLAFINGALLMNGIQINDFDIIRWIRQGYIPFHGAHQLLPEWMKQSMSSQDANILGGCARASGRAGPNLVSLRINTASLLHLLGVSEVPKPPVHVVARKIIQDLQLPVGLVAVVRKLDKLVGAQRQDWKLRRIGRLADSGTKYAGALVLIALKMMFGLDGHSENKISEFASQANAALQLKASSAFTMRKDLEANVAGTDHTSPTEMETLFVWKEWVRFIEYRRILLETFYVPSSIRARKMRQMDPKRMMRYARKEGELRCNRNVSFKKLSSYKKRQGQFMEIFEDLSKSFPSQSNPTPTEQAFRPCIFPHHGLAEQLLDFDPERFSLLRQSFPESSLRFTLRPKSLARDLHRVGYGLNVCQGPAYAEANLLSTDFVSSAVKFSKKKSTSVRFFSGRAKLKRNIKPVIRTSAKDSKELLLYQPSWAYWTRSVRCKTTLNGLDWKVLSNQLPPTFRWTLKLVAESLGEKQKDLYVELRGVETILNRWTQSVHSLAPKTEFDRKLKSARTLVL